MSEVTKEPLTPEEIAQRTDQMVEKCRDQGMRVTQQRIALFRELLESGEHLSAERLYERIRDRYPTMSLSTVYNSLETLSKLGLIGEVTGLDGPMLYDPEARPHHHMVCKDCGCVIDVFTPDAIRVNRKGLMRDGFEVDDFRVTLFGKCKGCSEQSAED